MEHVVNRVVGLFGQTKVERPVNPWVFSGQCFALQANAVNFSQGAAHSIAMRPGDFVSLQDLSVKPFIDIEVPAIQQLQLLPVAFKGVDGTDVMLLEQLFQLICPSIIA